MSEQAFEQKTAEYLTSKDAALLYRVTPDYIARLCKQGKLTGVLQGRSWLVSRNSLSAFFTDKVARTDFSVTPRSAQPLHVYTLPVASPALESLPKTFVKTTPVVIQKKRHAPSTFEYAMGSVALVVVLFCGVYTFGSVSVKNNEASIWSAFTNALASVPDIFFGNSAKPTLAIPSTPTDSTHVNANVAPVQTPVAAAVATPTQTIIQQNTYPITERTVVQKEVVTKTGISESAITTLIEQSNNQLRKELYTQLNTNPGQTYNGGGNPVANFALAQKIDQLSNVTITNATVHGITGLTASDIPALNYLSLAATLPISSGGTGTTTLPTYGQVLLGNASGGYDLVATSSLGIVGGGGGPTFAYPFPGDATSTTLTFGGFNFSNATGTNLFATVASTTKFYGANLTNCAGGFVLTWNDGSFNCVVDQTAAGAAPEFNFTPDYGVMAAATTSPIFAESGLFASSTSHFAQADFTVATSSAFAITTLINSLLATNANGQLVATSSLSTNYFNQASLTVSGFLSSADFTTFTNKISSSSLSAIYPFSYNASTGVFSTAFGTTTANTYSLLNTFNGGLIAINATTTNATTTTFAITGVPSALLKTLSNGAVVAAISGTDYAPAGSYATFGYLFPNNATTTQIAFNGGATFTGATSTALAVTGSTTISSQLNAVNGATFGSFTANFATTSQATTTNLAITGVSNALLKTLTNGAVVAAVAGSDYATAATVAAAFPFTATNAFGIAANSTSTLIGFTNGLYATASSTFTGGLTVFGGNNTTITNGLANLLISQTAGSQLTYNSDQVFLGNNSFIVWNGTNTYLQNTNNSGVLTVKATGTDGQVDVQGGPAGIVTITTGGSERVRVDAAGNVGIGTTSPFALLSVQGNGFFTGNITGANITATGTASSTNLVVSSLGASAGQCLTVNSSGTLSATSCGVGSTFPFTPTSAFGVNSSATSTALFAQSGIFASSTSHFTNADFVNATTSQATTTNLAITGTANTILKTLSNGSVVPAVAGVDYASAASVFGYLFPNNATTTQIAFNAGATFNGATTTALAVTGSSTISGQFNAVNGATFGSLTAGASTFTSTIGVTGLATLTGGISTNASSTFGAFTAGNATTTNATTTALAITGVSNALLKTLTNGAVVAAVANTDYTNPAGLATAVAASFPFTPTNNFALTTSATSTPLFAQNGIFASSTSHFYNLDYSGTFNYASTTASTTLFSYNGQSFIVASSPTFQNVAVGLSALTHNTTGIRNSAFGDLALNAPSFNGSYNSAFGYSAGISLTTGIYNTEIGAGADASNSTGNYDTIVGSWAGNRGNGNTALGFESVFITTNDFNTGIGHQADFNVTTGYGNIGLGASSTQNITTGGNNLGLGNNTYFPSATANNQLNIGNLIFGTIPATTTTFAVPNSGLLGVGSTSPFASFSIQNNASSSNTTLFAIGSTSLSTGGAFSTSTLFSVSNTGLVSSNSIVPNGPFTNNLASFNLGASAARWNSLWAGTVNVGTSTFSLTADVGSALGIYNSASGSGAEVATFTQSGNFGVGTSTPLAKLSVHANAGEVNRTLFTIASSTANATTTLFSVSNTGSTTIAGPLGVTSLATSSYAGGINVTSGCVALNGTCLTINGASLTSANLFTLLNTYQSGFISQASSTVGDGTQASGLTVSGGATTTGNLVVQGSGTSTIAGGVQASVFSLTSTTASSTAANGINLTGGCFSVNGTCVGQTVKLTAIRTYTSGATYTAPSNLSYVVVEAWGGGGGGNGVGSTDTGSPKPGSGGAAGNSSFGALVSATGGGGATQISTTTCTNGSAGVGSNGDVNLSATSSRITAQASTTLTAYDQSPFATTFANGAQFPFYYNYSYPFYYYSLGQACVGGGGGYAERTIQAATVGASQSITVGVGGGGGGGIGGGNSTTTGLGGNGGNASSQTHGAGGGGAGGYNLSTTSITILGGL